MQAMASLTASYCLTLSALKLMFLYSRFEICEATNKILYFVSFIPLKSLLLCSSSQLVSWKTKSLHMSELTFQARLAGLKILARFEKLG